MSPSVLLSALAASAILLMGLALWILFQGRPSPEKRERRRRLYVHRTGRLGDALITEVTDSLLHYKYSIQRVEYSASQDILALRDRMPEDLNSIIGVASLKYSPKYPANSILICEEWSGLRIRAAERHARANLA